MRRLAQPWQRRAFAYYNMVPEIKYAGQFYSRSLSLLRLFVGELQDDGQIEPSENTDITPYLDRIQDPGGGGREQLQATYGRLRFLNGECYLLVTKDPETEQEQWEMVSTVELRPEGSTYIRYSAPSLQPESFVSPSDDDYEPLADKDAIVYRLWQRHPEFSQLADCTMMGVMDVCEELVLLTQSVRARARSRLAGSGILLINGRYVPLPVEATTDEDPDVDPFMNDLNEAMTASIVDEASASAVVPMVVRVDAPEVGGLDAVMKHIQIIDPMQTYPETGLRMELIKRLSIGLDMPPEILVGLADSNHWNAWQVDEQTWKAHLQPVANSFVNDLTTAYLQPTLRNAGIADWARYVITYDATAVINHPDRSRDAKDLYDKRAIGKAALREANGFTDEDAPTPNELNEMIGVQVRDGSLAVYGIPGLRTGGIEPAPGQIETGGGGGTTQPTDQTGADTEKKPPAENGNAPDDPITSAAVEAFVERVLGASDLALLRAREVAGARLRNYARRDRDCEKAIDGVYGVRVAPVVGRERAKKIGAPSDRELVAGAAEILLTTLADYGVKIEQAQPLGERLEQHAAKTLYEARPAPLPASYRNYVVGLFATRPGREMVKA